MKHQFIEAHTVPLLEDGGADLSGSAKLAFPVGANAVTSEGKTRHVLMLGGSLLQLPAIRIAKEEGWSVILADGNGQVLARQYADYFEHIDLKDKEAMLTMARRYYENGMLHGVFTAATDFSGTVSWVTEALGLPGIPYEAAQNASSKLRMRKVFLDNDIPSPRFVEIQSETLPDYSKIENLDLPVVVKPVDNMGARGVRKLVSWEELKPAISDARSFSRHGSVIVEEFIEGPEYSIDSLVIRGKLVPCGIAERHVRFPPHFVEVGHTLPSNLDEKKTDSLIAVFSEAVAALGITTGAAKGDVFFTKKGPVIGEIAARLSGGYMSGWTYPYASGVEVTRAALYLAMGIEIPTLEPARALVSAERAFVPLPGTIASIEGLDIAANTAGVHAVFMRFGVGERTVFPRNNVEKAGNLIAVDQNRKIAMQNAETAASRVVLRLKPAQPDTDMFLFQPDAEQAFAYPSLRRFLHTRFPAPIAGFSVPDVSSGGSLAPLYPVFSDIGNDALQEQDWSWRSLSDTAQGIEQEGEIRYRAADTEFSEMDAVFWFAIAHGGLPGALYVLDTVRSLPPTDSWAWVKKQSKALAK